MKIKIMPFLFQFHFRGAQRNVHESIDIPTELNSTTEGDELRDVFLRSGFADENKGPYRLLPCATGTFVHSSGSIPTCKNCTAGKLQYSLNQLRGKVHACI